ncbi:glycosyltransferase family 2 protein [Mangrovitalea sediminis]|uniref:glycosyltransferase family 2 protein n=1 Tax=Mangrovitalea sediminis TaxID=1982043 RepID=UPI000BE606FB|nr:glycosyltransferase family 2 protein [Mangrovitalea sediminis]
MTQNFSGQDITVVIPAHNCERFIEDAICSVEAQTERPKEILIVENASSDKSYEVIQGLAAERKVPLRIVKTSCPGVSNARNLGFSLASTPLISMLDADDLYDQCFLSLALRAFNAKPELTLFFGNRRPLSDGNVTGDTFLEKTRLMSLDYEEVVPDIRYVSGDLFSELLKGSFVSCSGAVLQKEAAYRAGLFPVGLVSSEDRKFFCRLSLCGPSAYTLAVTHFYREHDASRTGRSHWIELRRNAIVALNMIRLELSNKDLSVEQQGRLDEAIGAEVTKLLYDGADNGWERFQAQRRWLESKGLSKGISPRFYLKALKN